MKYKLIILITALITICIIWKAKLHSYYSPAKERQVYQTMQHHDDTIRIAYIGDSWAFGHQFHKCKIKELLENKLQRPAIVSSYGIGGLTSKEIYHALFEINELKHFIEKGYNYCYISAGINDTNKKMSTSYYQESMICIIKFMLSNNIHPIIQEIPDYNIHLVYEDLNFGKKLIRQFSMVINNVSMDCKQQFREALDNIIRVKEYQNEVSIIRYKTWNNNYAKDIIDLYIKDQLHLNDRGYDLLDSMIAKTIIMNEVNKKKREKTSLKQ